MNLSHLDTKGKADVILKRSQDRQYLYELCLKMFALCDLKGLRLVVENPYSVQHFLVDNFPYKANIVDKDRTLRGDFYKKPTQYWFINCDNTTGHTEQYQGERRAIAKAKSGIKAGICSEERSMISPDYARNFICDFILGREQPDICPTLFNQL